MLKQRPTQDFRTGRARKIGWIAAVALLTVVPIALAGGGRIEISQKSVLSPPYSITQSGSYILTSPLVVTQSGVNAIWVQTSDVDIDLNGFTITGPGLGTTVSAIFQNAGYSNLRVHGGNVTGWGGPNSYGLNAAGSRNVIEDIVAFQNGRGIFTGASAFVERCVAYSNTTSAIGYGIAAGAGSRIHGCIVQRTHSTGGEVYGITAGDGSEIISCVAVVQTSASLTNDVYGIYVGRGGRIVRCVSRDITSFGAAYGICADDEGAVLECVSSSHTASDGAIGIYCRNRARVDSSVAYANDYGVKLLDDAVARGCFASEQDNDGFRFGSRCRLSDNFAYSNEVYGFWAEGRQSEVTDCDASANWIGFGSSASLSNLLVRNAGIANHATNFLIATGNAYGPVLDNPGRNFATEEAWQNFSIHHP